MTKPELDMLKGFLVAFPLVCLFFAWDGTYPWTGVVAATLLCGSIGFVFWVSNGGLK